MRIYLARPRYGPAERDHECSVFASGSKHQVFIGDDLGFLSQNVRETDVSEIALAADLVPVFDAVRERLRFNGHLDALKPLQNLLAFSGIPLNDE